MDRKIIGRISEVEVVITSAEMDALFKEIMSKGADLLAYGSTPNDIFYYVTKCKRLIEGQKAIIKHLEASHGGVNTAGKVS